MAEGAGLGEIDWRAELGRLAALVGAAGLAIAQPVLDSFGKSPETFVFRDAQGTDVALFALAVVLVPPLVLWSAGLLVAWRAPRWRLFLHGATVGLLIGLALVQILASLPQPVAVVAAVLLGIGGWVLTVRAKAFQLWQQLLALLPVMALLAFLFTSPASELLASEDFAAAATGAAAAPVVLIVLDELPTASIIDEAGAIDAVRFPNLARVAGTGTWYRNHTTLSGFTSQAVPTIFTGNVPDHRAPLFTEHPDNIFRLLAGSHDLVVSEALTRLCPTAVCPDRPQAPGATGTDGPEAQMGALFHDAIDLWLQRLAGSKADDAVAALGEFEEAMETAGSAGPTVAEDGWQDAVANQPERLTDFLAALEPGDRPLAAVLHLVSPHFPWRHLPDGRTYADPAAAADLPINGGNGGVAWVANLERQRHLLQASYADRLVGQVLGRLDEVGIYDDAAVVITADHGVAFQGAENRRLPEPDALPEIMWTPLIVKAPGQTEARVDDTNVESIDVLPTVAELIGVDIPWTVDGLAAGSEAQRARDGQKQFRRFKNQSDPKPSSDVDVDGPAGLGEVLGLAFPPVGADGDLLAALHSLSGHAELIGQAYDPAGDLAAGTIGVDDADRLLSSEELVMILSGTVADGRVDDDAVVAVVDDRIVAAAPVVHRNVGGPAYALLLPPGRTVDLADVRLALLRDGALLDAGAVGG